MRRSLIATAIGIALFGTSAWAGDIDQRSAAGDDTLTATSTDSDQNNDKSTGDNRNNDGAATADGYGNSAANNGSTSTATFTNAFNTNTTDVYQTFYGPTYLNPASIMAARLVTISAQFDF